ncbi:MAG TPA: phosphopantetheine-binding protein [Bacillota bacterium]|nr:phosphopantetheine-binding protein [Bacillota bacterium]
MDTAAKLKELLCKELNLKMKPEEITDDMPLFGDGLGLDSLDAVEIVVILKKHMGVTIVDSEQAQKVFVSIKTLTDFVEEELGKK